ncbi:uncharacterized protein STEHIDRAFT_111871 [Stereum hirsutum FP-91666 SS1]|uniref:uncharacterized protein n=1 Tax=Stereum hirsutum (strain FP-91666) TaxID=721885 RepID=UPI000444A714|nr:uncharacterized protein STEHIDRAFT_111871 [Stereum hirsutum FP-91666 SS1]EIM85260.1 hypothetical protein STEHIDRAFT_111871 [Stereum hirsutum FP-91666 SS1]
MSDSVSVLSRLAQERRCVAIYVPIQDPGGDWIVSVTLQLITPVVHNNLLEAHNAGTHLLGVVAQYSGIGRAKRIKQAKQRAAHDILSKLPLQASPPDNIADILQFIMDRHNGKVVFNALSKGQTLPQYWKFEILVNGNTHPLAVSDWGLRRDAIKQILRMACIHLGYLNAPPVVLMHIVLDDSDEEEVRELPNIYRAPEFSQRPIITRASSPAEVGPSASAAISVGRLQDTIQKWGSAPSVEIQPFLPCAVSDWLPPGLAKHQTLTKAFEVLGIRPPHDDADLRERINADNDSSRPSQTNNDRVSAKGKDMFLSFFLPPSILRTNSLTFIASHSTPNRSSLSLLAMPGPLLSTNSLLLSVSAYAPDGSHPIFATVRSDWEVNVDYLIRCLVRHNCLTIVPKAQTLPRTHCSARPSYSITFASVQRQPQYRPRLGLDENSEVWTEDGFGLLRKVLVGECEGRIHGHFIFPCWGCRGVCDNAYSHQSCLYGIMKVEQQFLHPSFNHAAVPELSHFTYNINEIWRNIPFDNHLRLALVYPPGYTPDITTWYDHFLPIAVFTTEKEEELVAAENARRGLVSFDHRRQMRNLSKESEAERYTALLARELSRRLAELCQAKYFERVYRRSLRMTGVL